MVSRHSRAWTILLAVGLVVVVGCSRSPEAQKARYLERGDKYAAREQYREAILEYRNVLRLEPANPGETAPVPGRLVLQHPGEPGPPGVMDALRQPRPAKPGHT